MNSPFLSVREIQQPDISHIINYWQTATPEFLTGMGVDLSKMPSKEEWETMLNKQISQPYEEKKAYCIIWMADNKPVGHCNVNKIIFGNEAYMHLHLWEPGTRARGSGTSFVKMTIPYFFKNLELETLYCEPYALNPAPNKTLPKAGFEFVRNYVTIPGWINFEQPVNLWQMTYEKFISQNKR